MLPHLKIRRRYALQRSLRPGQLPTVIRFGNGIEPPSIVFTEGAEGYAACLRCLDAPCIYYTDGELNVRSLTTFPSDLSREVCPTKALTWPIDTKGGPLIDGKYCTGCGLCVARCPVGAIYIGRDGLAHIADDNSEQLTESLAADAHKERQKFCQAKRVGIIRQENDTVMREVMERIESATEYAGTKFPNLFARNLMVSAGWNAAIRRAGDTNVRMDIVASLGTLLCTAEVEFSNQVIDAPRCVLDNLAVLISRYGQRTPSLIGLVIALKLPNQRSDYWQVIEDIEQILKLKIYTVTVGALMLLLWNNAKLGAALPYATKDSPTIRKHIEREIGRKLGINAGCEAVLESQK